MKTETHLPERSAANDEPARGGRVHPACSVADMRCDQRTADNIIARAKQSQFGLDDPERPVIMANYAPQGSESLAMALVGAYHAKYDLVALMQAAMHEAFEQGFRSASPPNAVSPPVG